MNSPLLSKKHWQGKPSKHPCSKCGFPGATTPIHPTKDDPKKMAYYCMGCIGRKVGYVDRKVRNRPTSLQVGDFVAEALAERDARIARLEEQVAALTEAIGQHAIHLASAKPMAQRIRELHETEPVLKKAEIARRLGATLNAVKQALRQRKSITFTSIIRMCYHVGHGLGCPTGTVLCWHVSASG